LTTPCDTDTTRVGHAGQVTTEQQGLKAAHNVDRDLPEIFQELRVAQTAGQIFFAFLFSIAFTPAFSSLTQSQRVLYGWDVFAVTASVAFLVGPVAAHRINFGRRVRLQLLILTHVMMLIGLGLLMVGIILGVTLVATVVFPATAWLLPTSCATVLVVSWIGVPAGLRVLDHRRDARVASTAL
jgi:hypothetical protein